MNYCTLNPADVEQTVQAFTSSMTGLMIICFLLGVFTAPWLLQLVVVSFRFIRFKTRQWRTNKTKGRTNEKYPIPELYETCERCRAADIDYRILHNGGDK